MSHSSLPDHGEGRSQGAISADGRGDRHHPLAASVRCPSSKICTCTVRVRGASGAVSTMRRGSGTPTVTILSVLSTGVGLAVYALAGTACVRPRQKVVIRVGVELEWERGGTTPARWHPTTAPTLRSMQPTGDPIRHNLVSLNDFVTALCRCTQKRKL